MNNLIAPTLNNTTPVYGIIGHVKAINIARPTERMQLRYVGYGNPDVTKGPTGQAHRNANQAADDVRNWYANKPVTYPKHAEMPAGYAPKPGQARLAAMVSTGVAATEAVTPDHSFVIGEGNTFFQAWEAMLAGHRVRRPDWHELYSWLLQGECREIWLVEGEDPDTWKASASSDSANAQLLLATDWIVLPKTDYIAPTV